MTSQSDPIIAEYVVESREHLADIENQLLAIEADGENINADLVNEVFRAVHSIKGAAGFLGFTTLGALAHSLENVLNMIRNRELVPNSANVDVMLRAADVLRGMIEDIQKSNDVDIAELVDALERVVEGESEAIDAAVEKMPSATTEENATAAELQDKPAIIDVQSHEGENKTADSETPKLLAQAEQSQPSQTPTTLTQPAQLQTQSTPPQSATQRAAGSPANSPSSAPVVAETNIRVSVGLLDNLMNLAGELVLSRNQLMQAVASTDGVSLDSVAGRLN